MATFPSLTSPSTYSPYHGHICTLRPISHLLDWFTNLYGQPLTNNILPIHYCQLTMLAILGLLDLWICRHYIPLWNVRNHSANNNASHPRSSEPSSRPLYKWSPLKKDLCKHNICRTVRSILLCSMYKYVLSNLYILKCIGFYSKYTIKTANNFQH
jgi:hypothetical protein